MPDPSAAGFLDRINNPADLFYRYLRLVSRDASQGLRRDEMFIGLRAITDFSRHRLSANNRMVTSWFPSMSAHPQPWVLHLRQFVGLAFLRRCRSDSVRRAGTGLYRHRRYRDYLSLVWFKVYQIAAFLTKALASGAEHIRDGGGLRDGAPAKVQAVRPPAVDESRLKPVFHRKLVGVYPVNVRRVNSTLSVFLTVP